MDTPMSEANNKIVISDVSSKSDEEEGQSSESEAPAPAPAEEEDVAAPPEMENNYQLMMIPEHDREYGCRYCHKRFSNKQALGGHQNAHKVERAMEKNVEETGDAIFFGGHSSYHGRMGMSAAPFLSSYHRPSEFLHRSLYNWNFASQQQAGGGVVHYNNPRPPPPPPAAGFNCGVYHGWSAPPAPRLPPFPAPARLHHTLPQNMNVRLANFGPGSSNAFMSDSGQGFSGFPGFGVRPVVDNRASAAAANLRNVRDDEQNESDLDLSLKL